MKYTSISVMMFVIVLISLTGCDCEDPDPDESVPVIKYDLLGSYPHDTTSYTEGLIIYNDTIFESTGSPYFLPQTRSVFGPVDPSTGRIIIKVELDEQTYFGEGITYLQDKFYQLTYLNRIGFVYDAATYERIGQFSLLSDEAWGLTTDGKSLIMSDGTDKLTFIDPNTFLVTRILPVSEKGTPKSHLNELEFIEGYIFANIWLTGTIAKIDTSNGKVRALIDLVDLQNKAYSLYSASREMNGIAYDPVSGRIFVTGKLWPEIYEINLLNEIK
jgi:glutaminyl-peptide cyclotransferase